VELISSLLYLAVLCIAAVIAVFRDSVWVHRHFLSGYGNRPI